MNARTTLYGRCYDVKTLKRRCYNVALTSCAGWELTDTPTNGDLTLMKKKYFPKQMQSQSNSYKLIIKSGQVIPDVFFTPGIIFSQPAKSLKSNTGGGSFC